MSVTQAQLPPADERPENKLSRASGRSIFIGIIALAVFLYFIKIVLLPFVLGGAAAYAISPGISWLTERCGGHRWIAATLTLILLLAIAAVAGFFAVPPATHALMRAMGDLQHLLTQLFAGLSGGRDITIFGNNFTPQALSAQIVKMASDWVTQNGQLFLLTGWVFSAAFGAMLCVVVFFYFLLSGPSLGAGLFRLVPPAQRPTIEEIWLLAGPVLRRYFIGIACVVGYASVAAYIGLGVFLQLPDAALLAIVTGLLELIPVIGPLAAAVMAGLVAVETAKGMWGIVLYIIYATALRLSIDDLVGPVILGRSGRIHPVLVIFCFLAGGVLYGISGLILAVPVALIVKAGLATLYQDHAAIARLRKQA